MVFKTIYNEKIESNCIGCSLVNDGIMPVLKETEHFKMFHDPELSIPGFCVISFKEHQVDIDNENINVKYELIDLIDYTTKIIKNFFNVKDVSVVYKAPTTHFYVMLIPMYPENLSKYGVKLSGITELTDVHRANPDQNNIDKIKEFIDSFNGDN